MGVKAFKSQGMYMHAEEGHLYGLSNLNSKGHFHVEEHDGKTKISLKTHNGHYVSVDDQHQIHLKHGHSGDEAKFLLEHHHGRVTLKAHHGGWLTMEQDGRVHVHHEHTEGALWEEQSV